MADKTESKQERTGPEFAAYLRKLADGFESGEEVRLTVGNKEVTVHPPESFDTEVSVVERSSALRGNKETVELTAEWRVK
ncbi:MULTISPECIES: amphi-Trp domain-containing protein [Haloprofundus]|uniref:amphi-Trp domain-containing protein n=1 Tax=Haloprofundus TaxID=1911573 RepID=UPI000E42E8FD|nr:MULTISPECIES: amphi-Trp domain-containing protein [Haloprofundus]QCJ46219.1 amphi-Trp domain-containing protein [Haloprofundus sp. MHR1]